MKIFTATEWFSLAVIFVLSILLAIEQSTPAQQEQVISYAYQGQIVPQAISNTEYNYIVDITHEEKELLYRITEFYTREDEYDDAEVIAFASHIINKIASPNYPKTLTAILENGSKLILYNSYKEKILTLEPTARTIMLVNEALNGVDTSNGGTVAYPKSATYSDNTEKFMEDLYISAEFEHFYFVRE